MSKADSDCTIATITGMDTSCHQVDVSATFYQGGEDNVVTHHLFQLTLECIPELNDPGVLFAMDRGNALRSAKNGLAPQSLFYADEWHITHRSLVGKPLQLEAYFRCKSARSMPELEAIKADIGQVTNLCGRWLCGCT